MKSNCSNAAGFVLMAAAVLILAELRRLDLLLIVAPLSRLFSYGMARVKSVSHSQRR
jgi:hypothetical protein